MIKLIVFDLDGVLVDAKRIHFETLNRALSEIGDSYVITQNEHLSTYDGLKTTEKLKLLTKNKGLPDVHYNEIWKRKQLLTLEAISGLKPNMHITDMFKELVKNGYKIACCSNSIRKSVLVMLSKIGVIEYMDLIISNEDVTNSKPHPEMYWKAMSIMGCLPEETLIIEDSPPGLLAASRSRANVLRVNSPKDLNITKIFSILQNTNADIIIPKWQDKNMNILIPMAGAGSRFEQAGYTFPKPLIEVMGKPMIQVVVENLNIDANYIYVVQESHRKKYNLDVLLNLITPNCKIVSVNGVTEGAACTTLLAKELIDTDTPLLLANSDQFLEWDSNEFMYKMIEQSADAGVVTFTATHPKWSFAKLNDAGYVIEVAEKSPISNVATVGVYYWAKGSDYVKYTEQMISKNIRTNNEFYVCPVFNEAIADNKRVKSFHIDNMWGMGTPEDLNFFIEHYKK